MGERDDAELGDEPPAALPAGPLPRPAESGWQINWWGFVPLALIGAVAFVGFRALGLGGGSSEGDALAGGSSTTTTTSIAPRRTTTMVATTTTVAAAPTAAPAPVRPAPAAPAVRAWGEVKPCRFGDACLAVSFTVSGFPDPQPTTFACVYPNSTRQFSFEGAGEVEACLTGDEGDIVYIEVDGVRSGGVSATTLNP